MTGMAFDNEKLYETRWKRGDGVAFGKSSVYFEHIFEGSSIGVNQEHI